MAIQRKLILKPSPEDYRDFSLASLGVPKKKSFLKSIYHLMASEVVDLEPWCGPVKDQLDLGACTGFTFAGYRELLLRKYFQYESATKDAVFSPLFLYWWERYYMGTINEDSGSYLREGCKTLAKNGICIERDDIYKPVDFKTRPSDVANAHAAAFRISSYHRLNKIEEWKESLRSGLPVAIGFNVRQNLFDIGSDGLMRPSNPNDTILGGHAVLVIGLDEGKRLFKIRNSWGDFGLRGNFFMPYDTATLEAFDAWTLTTAYLEQ